MVARMEQTRSRLARWRVAGLAVLLAASLVALVPLAITAIDQANFNDGWAAYKSGDYATAHCEWRPLAEYDHVKAQYNLGSMYSKGQGVPKNYAEAVRWTRKAAEQGFAKAQTNLGVMYAQGQGVPRDYVRAHMWISLAAAQGLKYAVKLRKIHDKQLTLAQLAEAGRLAREWKKEHRRADETQGTIAIVVEAYAVAVDTTLARILALVSPRKSAPTIVGEWQSAQVLGQLGLMQTTATFNEDGSFTVKLDLIHLGIWTMANGTYSVTGDKVCLDFDKRWFVTMRGGEEVKRPDPGLARGKARRAIAHWKDGKLMMKDVALERIK